MGLCEKQAEQITYITNINIAVTEFLRGLRDSCKEADEIIMTIKNTTIRKRKNGLYELRYYSNGKQTSLYARTQSALRAKYNKRKKPQVVQTLDTIKLCDWYQLWLKKYKTPILKPKSLKLITNSFNKYILPQIGNIALNRLTEDVIQNLLNGIIGKERTKTLVYIHLNDCLSKAVPEHIANNPMQKIVIKKYNGEKGKALTRAQQNQLTNYLDKSNNKYKNLFYFYLNTGARLNEALNLKLSDVDYDNKTIHINGTKTKSANRTIPVNDNVLNLIDKKEIPFDFNERQVQKEFKMICQELGFEKITIHSLRHTFVTRCIEKGIKLTTIQKWVGHSSIKITSDIYGDIQSEFEREELAKLD